MIIEVVCTKCRRTIAKIEDGELVLVCHTCSRNSGEEVDLKLKLDKVVQCDHDKTYWI